jgi:hypothetical protein
VAIFELAPVSLGVARSNDPPRPHRNYCGLLAARNCEFIHPFQRPPSTWTHSPARFVILNRVPLGALPKTMPVADGAALMFTPGRCRKTVSTFRNNTAFPADAIVAPWAVIEAGRSHATAAGGSGAGSRILALAAGSGVTSDDCTECTIGAVSVGCVAVGCAAVFSPAAVQKNASTPLGREARRPMIMRKNIRGLALLALAYIAFWPVEYSVAQDQPRARELSRSGPVLVFRKRESPVLFSQEGEVRFQNAYVDQNGSIRADGHNLDLYGAVLIRRDRICTSAEGARGPHECRPRHADHALPSHRPRKKAAQLRACNSSRHGRDASTFSLRAFHAA